MLNVVLAANDDYSQLLLIALFSLLEHNKNDFQSINVFILDDGITDINKTKINDLMDEYPCRIQFIKTKDLNSFDISIMAMERLSGTSLTTYARLFMSSLLPNDIEKVIYLDCDALIMGSFKELWDTDITDYYCAGVLDTLNENGKKLYGYSKEDNYINAGFLYVNLEKWRKDNVEIKFVEFLSENQGTYFVHDQGVINKVFKDQIKIIEPKYNLQYYFQFCDYDIAKKFRGIENEYYSKEIVDYSRNNPIFLHFCGNDYGRPWRNKDHKYNKIFVKYAKMVNCENVVDYIDAPTLKSKLFFQWGDNRLIKIFLKLIPFKMVKNVIDSYDREAYDKQTLNAKSVKINND